MYTEQLEEKFVFNWVRGHDTPYDWNIWDLWLANIPFIPAWRKLSKYNQGKNIKTQFACTIVNAYREFCYQMDHVFTEEELLKIIDFSYWLWFDWYWRQSSSWMNAVRKYFKEEYSFVKIMYNDPLLWEIYKNNNALGFTYKGNSQWNLDSDDWVLDWVDFWTPTYWHRTSTIVYNKPIVCDDSYDWSKWNIYELPRLIELVKKWYVYPTFYLWIPKVKNTDRINELYKFKVACESTIDLHNKKLWYTNDVNYKKRLIDDIKIEESKLKDIKTQLLLLEK